MLAPSSSLSQLKTGRQRDFKQCYALSKQAIRKAIGRHFETTNESVPIKF